MVNLQCSKAPCNPCLQLQGRVAFACMLICNRKAQPCFTNPSWCAGRSHEFPPGIILGTPCRSGRQVLGECAGPTMPLFDALWLGPCGAARPGTTMPPAPSQAAAPPAPARQPGCALHTRLWRLAAPPPPPSGARRPAPAPHPAPPPGSALHSRTVLPLAGFWRLVFETPAGVAVPCTPEE